MTSDFAARSVCQVRYDIKNLGEENMVRLEKIHTANGGKPKSEKPEIAADVLGISFLAKLPGAEVHRGDFAVSFGWDLIVEITRD